MVPTSVKVLQARLDYRGRLSTRGFALLGNPAVLYNALLDRLGPNFGTELSSLGTDLATLENAHVSCQLPRANATLRVGVEHLAVEVLGVREIGSLHDQIIDEAWFAVKGASPDLAPIEEEVDYRFWVTLPGRLYPDIFRLVAGKGALDGWDSGRGSVWRVVGTVRTELTIDQATGVANAAFIRILQSGLPAQQGRVTAFVGQVAEILSSVGLSLDFS